MEIIITIKENDKVIAKRTALNSFESAEENLGKLQNYWESLERSRATDNKAEGRAEFDNREVY